MCPVEILVDVVWALGGLISLIGWFMMLTAAFRESSGWGMAVLFLGPFGWLAFVIRCWPEARRAFSIQMTGFLINCGAMALAILWGFSIITKVMNRNYDALPDEITETFLEIKELKIVDTPALSKNKKTTATATNTFIGLSVREMRRKFGPPKAVLKAEGRTTFFYPNHDMEFVSENGRTISAQKDKSAIQ